MVGARAVAEDRRTPDKGDSSAAEPTRRSRRSTERSAERLQHPHGCGSTRTTGGGAGAWRAFQSSRQRSSAGSALTLFLPQGGGISIPMKTHLVTPAPIPGTGGTMTNTRDGTFRLVV